MNLEGPATAKGKKGPRVKVYKRRAMAADFTLNQGGGGPRKEIEALREIDPVFWATAYRGKGLRDFAGPA